MIKEDNSTSMCKLRVVSPKHASSDDARQAINETKEQNAIQCIWRMDGIHLFRDCVSITVIQHRLLEMHSIS